MNLVYLFDLTFSYRNFFDLWLSIDITYLLIEYCPTLIGLEILIKFINCGFLLIPEISQYYPLYKQHNVIVYKIMNYTSSNKEGKIIKKLNLQVTFCVMRTSFDYESMNEFFRQISS